MSAYKGGTTYSANEDAAQSFLDDKLSKNKFNSSNNYSDYSTEGFDPSSYTSDQLSALNASGGPKKFGAGSYDVVTNQDEIDASNNSLDTATSSWDGKNYTRNSMNADDLKNHFGLQDGGDVGSGFNADAGASDDDKTKGNSLLGDGYLSNDNFEKLRNSDEVWDAYAAIEGQAAADKKREGNPDGLSINTLDGLFDNLTAEADTKEAPEPIMGKEEIVHSPEIQQAKERVGKYENDVLSGKTSQQIYGGADAFENSYQLNLQDVPSVMTNNKYQFTAGDTEFSGSDVSPEAKTPAPQQAASSFLENQKKKTIKQANIQPVG